MADGTSPSIKSRVSEAEWQVRVELAALYRLVALNGWDDMIFSHISARVPGPEHHFLINPRHGNGNERARQNLFQEKAFIIYIRTENFGIAFLLHRGQTLAYTQA